MATMHYPIGGSTIEITGLCPGSVEARKPYKNAPAGEAAERGTRIHKYSELLWKQEFQGYAPTKTDKAFIKRLSEDEKKVGVALVEATMNVCINLGFAPAEVNIEQQYMFRENIAGGTPDGDAHKAFGDLLILDWKTGFVQVDADQNIQELFYGCTKLRNMDVFEADTIENVHLVILQPEQPESPIIQTKLYTLTREEMRSWDETFDLWVSRAIVNPDLRIPGTHCVNCPAAAKCKEYKVWTNDETHEKLALIEMGNEPWIGDGAELAKLYKESALLKSFAKALTRYVEKVEAEVKLQARKAPNAVPGYILVDSYGHAKWSDEKEVAKKAKELGLAAADIKTPANLISPNQMKILCSVKGVDASWINKMKFTPVTGQKIEEGQAKSLEELFGAAI